MIHRLGDEPEDGNDRPGQNPRLPPRKPRDHRAPRGEPLLHVVWTVEEIVKTLGKGARSCRQPDRITQRHLLEGKKQVGSGFDRDRVRRDFAMLAVSQQLAEKRFAQRLIPPLVSFPFIAALPVFIERIAKAFWKITQKLHATATQACRWRGLTVSYGS